MAERSVEALMGQTTTRESAKHMLDVFTGMFNLSLLPQAVRPIFEVLTNKQIFTGRPIETEADKEMLPWARGGPGANRTLKAVAEETRNLPKPLQFSPPQAEALVRGYLNTWGLYGLTLSDAVFFNDTRELRTDQYPVLRRFYAQEPARNTRYVTELYQLIDEATQTRRTMRAMDRANRTDIADELEGKTPNLRYAQGEKADQTMRSIRAEISTSRRSKA